MGLEGGVTHMELSYPTASLPTGLASTVLKKLQITNAGEGVEKSKYSFTVGRNVNWCSHSGEKNITADGDCSHEIKNACSLEEKL